MIHFSFIRRAFSKRPSRSKYIITYCILTFSRQCKGSRFLEFSFLLFFSIKINNNIVPTDLAPKFRSTRSF